MIHYVKEKYLIAAAIMIIDLWVSRGLASIGMTSLKQARKEYPGEYKTIYERYVSYRSKITGESERAIREYYDTVDWPKENLTNYMDRSQRMIMLLGHKLPLDTDNYKHHPNYKMLTDVMNLYFKELSSILQKESFRRLKARDYYDNDAQEYPYVEVNDKIHEAPLLEDHPMWKSAVFHYKVESMHEQQTGV
jgi:hypothetical protein